MRNGFDVNTPTTPAATSGAGEGEIERAVTSARGALVAVGGFSFVINLLMLTISIYMMQVFDRVLTSRSTETLLYLSIIAVGAVFILSVLDFLRGRVMQRIGIWLDRKLAHVGFERAIEGELVGTGLRTQILRDHSEVRNFLSAPAALTLFDAPWVPVYLFVIYILHPMLGHVALAGAVVLFAIGFVNDATTSALLGRSAKKMGANMRTAEGAVTNAEAVDALGMKNRMAMRWANQNEQALGELEAAGRQSGMLHAGSKFFRMALQIVLLGGGAYLVLQDELSPGAIIAASIIASRALAPLEQAIGSWRGALQAWEAFKRLKVQHAAPRLREEGMALPIPEGALEVENLSYLPPGAEKPTLLRVNFKLPAGEMLAVVGPSASGKTSLARLLVGVAKPAGGTVRLDGADVFTWPRSDLGRHLGYLPQDVELFDGTIGENIARLSDAEPALVVDAARLAAAHDMILRLPKGYDTPIGDGGRKLAGGQRQRIALARALLGEVRLVVLDEPNASLDAEGEKALTAALTALKARGVTTVVLGHRLPFIELADKMLVLKEGQMALFGPREGVIKKLRELDEARPIADKATSKEGTP